MNYKEQLNDGRWIQLKDKRLEIDGFRCTQCSERIKLNVHHVIYIKEKKAWEYELKDLITLCRYCHETYHIKEKKYKAKKIIIKKDKKDLLEVMPPKVKNMIIKLALSKKYIA